MFLPFLPEIPGRSAITIERTTEPKCQMRLPEQEGEPLYRTNSEDCEIFPPSPLLRFLIQIQNYYINLKYD